MSAFVIDAFEFCRAKEHLEGEIAVADLARLCEDTADNSGVIRWSLQGGTNSIGYPELSLSVSGVVNLMCQRCLTPYAFKLVSDSTLVLAENESDVDGVDMLVDDDTVDVIVGSRMMDVLVLVEDDALLALPLSPKHDVCPDQGARDILTDSGKVSPFAVLKNIKQ